MGFSAAVRGLLVLCFAAGTLGDSTAKPVCIHSKSASGVNLMLAAKGYDPTLSNPFSIDGDPGFRAGRIFDHDCANLIATDGEIDWSSGFYDYVTVAPDHNCQSSMSSKMTSSFSEYVQERTSSVTKGRSFSASASVSLFVVSVSASHEQSTKTSTDEKEINKALQSQKAELALSKAKCFTHDYTISSFTRPVFNKDFITALEKVEAAALCGSDEEKKDHYIRFTKEFGTHFVKGAQFGSSLVFQKVYNSKSTSTEQYKERQSCFEKSSNTCVGVGVDAGVVKTDIKTCVANEDKKCSDSKNTNNEGDSETSEQIFITSRGSRPTTLADWAKSNFNPVAIDLNIEAIETLLTEENLSQNENYGFSASLDAEAITNLLAENAPLHYCTGVLDLTEEECNADTLTGCGFTDNCALGEVCTDDETADAGFVCTQTFDDCHSDACYTLPKDKDVPAAKGTEQRCIFPFKHPSGVTYNNCKQLDSDPSKRFCATGALTPNGEFYNDGGWGLCREGCPVNAYNCKATTGDYCRFPFTYEGVLYNSCTKNNAEGKAMCATATSGSSHRATAMRECEEGCPLSPHIGCSTAVGDCVFPFVFQGKTYNECTWEGRDYAQPWCATQTGIGAAYIFGKWGFCYSGCPMVENCVTTANVKCVFPFKYDGVTYTKCTKANGHTKPWCATRTSNGNYDNAWGFCEENQCTSRWV